MRLGAGERALYQAHFRAKAGVSLDADLLHSLGAMAAIQGLRLSCVSFAY
jgi:hypothetical protein